MRRRKCELQLPFQRYLAPVVPVARQGEGHVLVHPLPGKLVQHVAVAHCWWKKACGVLRWGIARIELAWMYRERRGADNSDLEMVGWQKLKGPDEIDLEMAVWESRDWDTEDRDRRGLQSRGWDKKDWVRTDLESRG